MNAPSIISPILIEFLLVMLDGATFANAIMPWEQPGPIRLPDNPGGRRDLIIAHIRGDRADVLYVPNDRPARLVYVFPLALAAFCPAVDGMCRWLAIDLDGPDHGDHGLQDPAHPARCIAQAGADAGLMDGLLVARSRGGLGLHLFLFPPAPCTLLDGGLVIAALVADAYNIAKSDMSDFGTPHAFRSENGKIALPGQSGAVELFPHSTTKPEIGWAIALPAAGMFAATGGGVIIDPFSGEPTELLAVPRADSDNWLRFLDAARSRRERHVPRRPASCIRRPSGSASLRVDPRTQEFLAGRVQEGKRSNAAYASACHLLGLGIAADEVRSLILDGAAACGLPVSEARNAVNSALTTLRRRGRL